VAALPARPRSPRDKPTVEVAVQIAQRWILARMRNETFFSLAELNQRIEELLEDLNNRVIYFYLRNNHTARAARVTFQFLSKQRSIAPAFW
jgi:hypothetical protein